MQWKNNRPIWKHILSGMLHVPFFVAVILSILLFGLVVWQLICSIQWGNVLDWLVYFIIIFVGFFIVFVIIEVSRKPRMLASGMN
jgi:hypothetical protein